MSPVTVGVGLTPGDTSSGALWASLWQREDAQVTVWSLGWVFCAVLPLGSLSDTWFPGHIWQLPCRPGSPLCLYGLTQKEPCSQEAWCNLSDPALDNYNSAPPLSGLEVPKPHCCLSWVKLPSSLLCILTRPPLDWGHQTFSIKGQIVNILGFGCHKMSFKTT